MKALLDLLKQCKVYDWKNEYKGEEKKSTGSLYWKLIFQLEDDTLCVYSGYTKDGTHLPESYGKFYKGIQSVIEK